MMLMMVVAVCQAAKAEALEAPAETANKWRRREEASNNAQKTEDQ